MTVMTMEGERLEAAIKAAGAASSPPGRPPLPGGLPHPPLAARRIFPKPGSDHISLLLGRLPTASGIRGPFGALFKKIN